VPHHDLFPTSSLIGSWKKPIHYHPPTGWCNGFKHRGLGKNKKENILAECSGSKE